jgi:hypothetical protein
MIRKKARPGAARTGDVRNDRARFDNAETTMIKTTSVLVAVFCLIAPAFADDETPDSDHGRYSFSKITDGLLRLDMKTGEVSVCSQRAVGWACQVAPDDRAVLENEIARLRTENAALKKDILDHGLPLPPGAGEEAAVTPNHHDDDVTIRLPDNSDLDRMVALAGRLWHRFVDAIARAQKQVLDNKS